MTCKEDEIGEIVMILDAWKLNLYYAWRTGSDAKEELKQIAKAILGTIKEDSKNITEGKGKIYVCPRCEGRKEDNEACPSPMIGGGDYRPPCFLCDGRGYIIPDKDRRDG